MSHDYRMFFGVVMNGVTLAFAPVADAGQAGSPGSINYARPFEPPTRAAFLPLPPGAVEPAGWSRDWCLAARDGFTGHMDEYDDEFKRESPERLTLVPYGCTKFRISMFPVTEEPEVKPSAIRRILFLGNSITLHPPNADIGWTANWGMAASSEDKDYVHRVTRALAQHAGSTPRIMVRNIADFERNDATYDVAGQLKDLFAFDPDLVVLAIGENVPALDSEEAKAQFKAGVMIILRSALAKRHPLVLVRSCFWADATKDQLLRQACQEADAIFVDAGPLGRDAANAARAERSFTHDGVAGHPGDLGMKALADAIVEAVLKRAVRQ